MGNSTSNPADREKDDIPPEAEQIMMEILLGKTADGDKFPSNNELKGMEQSARRSHGRDGGLRHSRLVSAFSNTREVQVTKAGRVRRHTVKQAWAQALASRRTKEMKTRESTLPTARESLGLQSNKRLPKRRRGTRVPTNFLNTRNVDRVPMAA